MSESAKIAGGVAAASLIGQKSAKAVPVGTSLKITIFGTNQSSYAGTASYNSATGNFNIYQGTAPAPISSTTFLNYGDNNEQLWTSTGTSSTYTCSFLVNSSFTAGSASCLGYGGPPCTGENCNIEQ